MKRKTIIKSALALPVAAAAMLIAFSQKGMAEDFLEIAQRPDIAESAMPDKAMRIVRSEGFFYEDFESMTEGVLTDGWVTTATPGVPDGKWGVGSLSTDGKAMAGTSGYTYAYILGNRDKENGIPHDAWLFSPELEMEADKEYIIEFCTYMGASPTSGEVLRIALLSDQSADAIIKEIDTIEDGSGVWRLNTYTYTPAEGGTYYLGFNCQSPVLANATLIDDVKVSEGPTSGFFGLAGVDAGITDMLKGAVTAEYEVTNRGTQPLELSFKSASPEISVSGLPMTLNYRKYGTFTIEFTPSKPGKFNGELVIATNDPAHPEVTLLVKANVLDVPVTNYAYEDFEAGGPQGWIFTVGGINTDYCGGHNGARAFYTRNIYCLSEDGPIGFTTHYVNLGDDPEFSFWYKLTDCDLMGVATGPTTDEIPVMQVSVSTDNGTTYTPVWELGQDSGRYHNQSDEFQQIRIPLKEYAGKCARIKFEIWGDEPPLEHDFIIQVDDVAIGTPHKVDLRAVDLTGTYRVVTGEEGVANLYVENLGKESVASYKVQILDELGTIVGETSANSINPGEKKPVTVNWILDRKGTARLHAVAVAAGDSEPANDSSNTMAIDLISADNTAITIGEGQEYISSSHPLNLGSRDTASQSIYYANEIGTDRGVITSISLTGMMPNDHLTESFEVWIKESDREDFNDNGWEDPATFTKVFEDQVFLPAGRHEFVIPFDTPFEYNGKNIIVMIRKMSDVFIVNKPMLVHESDILRSSFCSYLQKDQMIPGAYAERNATNAYAHATFNIVKAPSGKVSGKVSDDNGTLANAKISVEGTQLYTLSNASGNYSLPEVATGERKFSVTKYGYYPSTGNPLTIAEGDDLTKDFILTPYPMVTLSGTVSDEYGSPIEDVRIYLEGYADYKSVTDEKGYYEIKNIYGDTGAEYVLRTESSFFEPLRKKINITSDKEENLTLGNSHLRVHNLKVTATENSLRLDWEAPIAEFKHDNGQPVDYMGWNHGHSECAIFSTYHKHMVVKEIRWYTSNVYGPHANFNVFLFGIDENGYPDPNNILYMAKNVDFTDEAWNSHILLEPIEVYGCAVGISCDGLLGLGRTEADEEHPFTPLMHFFSGDSYKYELGISDFTSFIDCHPMLRLGGDYLGDLDDKNRRAIRRPDCQYEVYRLTGSGWNDRTFIGSTTDINIEDLEYASIPDGKYRYAVVAKYPSGESDEVVSRTISIDHSGIEKVDSTDFNITYDNGVQALLITSPENIISLEIYNAEGLLVMKTENIIESVSLGSLADGMYIARAILKDQNTTTLKFTK